MINNSNTGTWSRCELTINSSSTGSSSVIVIHGMALFTQQVEHIPILIPMYSNTYNSSNQVQ